MPDFFDHLPSHERERIRKRMRSPEAYERLREKVKGPEDLEKEMKRSEQLAEVHFALETDHALPEKMKSSIEKDLREQGTEAVLESDQLSADMRQTIESGKFSVAVSSHPSTHDDALIIIPEGNIQEKIPVKVVFSERYIQQALGR